MTSKYLTLEVNIPEEKQYKSFVGTYEYSKNTVLITGITKDNIKINSPITYLEKFSKKKKYAKVSDFVDISTLSKKESKQVQKVDDLKLLYIVNPNPPKENKDASAGSKKS